MKKQSKQPIRLRKRKLKSGNETLYLDIYLDGKRWNEYLKMYLWPGTTKDVREHNKETLRLAEAILAKRIIELQDRKFGFESRQGDDLRFFDYYKACAEKRKQENPNRQNWGDWYSNLKHMEKYEPRKDILLKDITKQWVEGYKEYLATKATAFGSKFMKSYGDHPLAKNSQQTYFRKLRACLNEAYENGLIRNNPLKGVKGVRGEESKRTYLTLEEITKLADTPCRYPDIKRAFMFSCLSGLRKSDIEKLMWGDVSELDGMTRIIFRQKKTAGLEYLDLSPQAVKWMGTRGKPTDKVFPNLHSITTISETLKDWTYEAGIHKHITFHCGRHTFATLMLTLGTDLFTVSKLLGHRNVHTTEIYAKVLDSTKRKAVNSIPEIGHNLDKKSE